MSKDSLNEQTPLFQEVRPSKPRPHFKNEVIERAIEAIATISMAPDAIGMQSALAAISIACQGFADVETLGGDAPTSLFLITIAKSGERKSVCDKLATKPIHDVQKERSDRYAIAKARFENAQSTQTNIDVIEDDGDCGNSDNPKEPMDPKILLSNLTLPSLYHHFDNGNPSVGIVSPDAGQFFGGHSMRKENLRDTAATLSILWDGGRFDCHRVSSGSNTYYGRRVSMHMMMQPVIAQDVLADPILTDQGFLARTLICWPSSRIGKRQIHDPEAYKRETAAAHIDLAEFHDRIRSLLKSTLPTRDGNPLELNPHRLALSEIARRQLVDFYNRTEAGLKEDGLFAHIQGFVSKLPEQACRIATLLTIFEDEKSTDINDACMHNAIEIAEWYMDELLRLRECGYVTPELRDAERLRVWLRANRSDSLVTVRELLRTGPRPTHNSDYTKKLMGILESYGWIRKMPPNTMIHGTKSKLSWRVLP